MDQNLKRSIILENYQHPQGKGLIEDSSYFKVNMNNESCIDEIDLMVKIEDNIVKDIRFDGEACTICTSSTSIMIETVLNKTLEEIAIIEANFEAMIDEKEFDKDILESALVYEDISKQPNRKKCALLPWWGIKKVINEFNKNI